MNGSTTTTMPGGGLRLRHRALELALGHVLDRLVEGEDDGRPSVEGRSVWATGRRRASVWTTTLAARPRISFSSAYSTPDMPVLSRPT